MRSCGRLGAGWLRQSVYVEDALQVVRLVLEDYGCKALDILLYQLKCGRGGVLYINISVSENISSHIGNRETTLRAGRKLSAQCSNSYVGIDLKGVALFVEALHCHYSLEHSYLRTCNSHTILRGVGYCLYHKLCKHSKALRCNLFASEIGGGAP